MVAKKQLSRNLRKTHSNKKSRGHATKQKYKLKNAAIARLKRLYSKSKDSPEVDDIHMLSVDINTQLASNVGHVHEQNSTPYKTPF